MKTSRAIFLISSLIFSACTTEINANEPKEATPTSTFNSLSGESGPSRIDRNIVYAMYSGLALTMDVYYPENSNGHGIIFISGSGWTRELSLDATPLTATGQENVYAAPLAEAGYTVFNVNHRAAPRFRYPAPIKDVQRAVRFIRYNAEEFGISPDRIGAMGGSSGGHLAASLGVMDGEPDINDPGPIGQVSSKVQAVVARAGAFDQRDNPASPLFGFRSNAAPEGSVELALLTEGSPITYVTPDDPPFLLIHGDADPVVPFERSEQMQAALQDVGVETELITVKGGGHGPRFEFNVVIDGERVRQLPDNPPDYIGAMIDWFDRHLIGSK